MLLLAAVYRVAVHNHQII